MNIVIKSNITVQQEIDILYSKSNNVNLLFSLDIYDFPKTAIIDFQFIVDLMSPIFLDNKKVLIRVIQSSGLFGLKKSVQFQVFKNLKKRYNTKYCDYKVEMLNYKYSKTTNRIVVESLSNNNFLFGPRYNLIYDNQLQLLDEFCNPNLVSQVLGDCIELGFLMPEYTEPIPLYITGPLHKIKPRLCSTCIYYSHGQLINCAVNLAPKASKYKVDFDCIDYTFDEKKYIQKS